MIYESVRVIYRVYVQDIAVEYPSYMSSKSLVNENSLRQGTGIWEYTRESLWQF